MATDTMARMGRASAVLAMTVMASASVVGQGAPATTISPRVPFKADGTKTGGYALDFAAPDEVTTSLAAPTGLARLRPGVNQYIQVSAQTPAGFKPVFRCDFAPGTGEADVTVDLSVSGQPKTSRNETVKAGGPALVIAAAGRSDGKSRTTLVLRPSGSVPWGFRSCVLTQLR